MRGYADNLIPLHFMRRRSQTGPAGPDARTHARILKGSDAFRGSDAFTGSDAFGPASTAAAAGEPARAIAGVAFGLASSTSAGQAGRLRFITAPTVQRTPKTKLLTKIACAVRTFHADPSLLSRSVPGNAVGVRRRELREPELPTGAIDRDKGEVRPAYTAVRRRCVPALAPLGNYEAFGEDADPNLH